MYFMLDWKQTIDLCCIIPCTLDKTALYLYLFRMTEFKKKNRNTSGVLILIYFFCVCVFMLIIFLLITTLQMFKLILIQYSSVVTRRIILIKSGKIIKCGCNWSKRNASNINIFLIKYNFEKWIWVHANESRGKGILTKFNLFSMHRHIINYAFLQTST